MKTSPEQKFDQLVEAVQSGCFPYDPNMDIVLASTGLHSVSMMSVK
jgi:hypothetical protein